MNQDDPRTDIDDGFGEPERFEDEGFDEQGTDETPDPHAERLVNDRPSKEGLPPDFGPEERVLGVHPAFFRAKPVRSALLILLPLIAAGATFAMMEPGGSRTTTSLTVGGIGAAVCWVPLAVWWLIATRGRGLEITNKRTVERRGLLSKSTDEVLHDHVRNVKVDQSFYDRIVRIGQIGIASSGSDQTEIVMEDLPNPQRIREVIDLYRPLD